MDQAVGLPALNGCFIDGIFFVANHLTTQLPVWLLSRFVTKTL
jgi:hypothetical protein